MSKAMYRFMVALVVMLGIAFGLHIFALKLMALPLFNNKIVLSYVVNAILALIIYFSLNKLKNRYSSQIGFLFLFGSVLKFVVFFVLFYPLYRADGVMDKMEFAAFFIPYAISLILETFFLSKMLNKMT